MGDIQQTAQAFVTHYYNTFDSNRAGLAALYVRSLSPFLPHLPPLYVLLECAKAAPFVTAQWENRTNMSATFIYDDLGTGPDDGRRSNYGQAYGKFERF